MFKRNIRLYIDDIKESISAIQEFTLDIDFEKFTSDRKTYSATLREFIVIGEAISHIPENLKERFPQVEWRQIKDFRNFIVHEYFGIDAKIVWDAVEQELPLLKNEIARLEESLQDS